MNMPLALVELLINNHEQIATSLKNQAFSYRDKTVPEWKVDRTDEKWHHHLAFLSLHYALRAFRRRWDQPWKPLSRNMKREGQQVLQRTLFDVFDGLLECAPHTSASSPARQILELPCVLKETVRLQYLTRRICNDISANDFLSGERVWVTVRTDGLTFRRVAYRAEFCEHETVAEYSLQMERSTPAGSLGDELEMFGLVRLLARQTYADLVKNPSRWVPVVSTLRQERADARELLKGLLGGLTRSNVELLAKHRSVLADVFSEIQKETL
jgi:hypothetical protein